MGFFVRSSFVMHSPTRKSTGTPTCDLEIGREAAFPFVSSLLGNFAHVGSATTAVGENVGTMGANLFLARS